MDNKRYQVFISSTFWDLKEERKEIMQALLEMDCIPAGMELFPAGNESQWELIQGIIDESDYYLVVVGGRYGSVSEEGISYTEMEYDYAVAQGIPVMGFVHGEPDDIQIKNTDKNPELDEKLKAFRAKVQKRITKSYTTPAELGSVVTRALIQLIRKNPRPGWVRGDQAMSDATRVEIAQLETKLANLEKEKAQKTPAIEEIDTSFAHGGTTVKLQASYRGKPEDDYVTKAKWVWIEYSWDRIIEILGPSMIDEETDRKLRIKLNDNIVAAYYQQKDSEPWSNPKAEIADAFWDGIVVQLKALNVMAPGVKKRTASDTSTYWRLTPAGDQYLTKRLAIRAQDPSINSDPNY